MPNSRGTFDKSRSGAWRRCALAAAALAVVLLPVGASKAGWLSDLLKGRKPEHASKPHASKSASLSRRHARREASLKREQQPREKSKSAVLGKPPAAKPGEATCDPAKFHLVVDVGHTRKSDGAMSARDVPEVDFNLRLATRLVDRLKSEGFTRTSLMVTEGKARPSLFERVAAANKSNAELFLSIHHDSVPDKLMENWEFEGKKRKFSDRFSGWSLFVSHRNPHYDASLAFAKLIGAGLKTKGLKFADQYTMPIMGRYRRDLLDSKAGVYRYDNLIVLERTEMPAVLLEAGSIINRDEEVAMASPERQDVIIGVVTAAVKEYCGPEPAPLQASADRK